MKEKIKQILSTGLFYISLYLVVLFFMITLKPDCVGARRLINQCIIEDDYYLFSLPIFILIVFVINFIKRWFGR